MSHMWSNCFSSVFFWLKLDSQSFKIVRKFYLPHPAFSSSCSCGDINKP